MWKKKQLALKAKKLEKEMNPGDSDSEEDERQNKAGITMFNKKVKLPPLQLMEKLVNVRAGAYAYKRI